MQIFVCIKFKTIFAGNQHGETMNSYVIGSWHSSLNFFKDLVNFALKQTLATAQARVVIGIVSIQWGCWRL